MSPDSSVSSHLCFRIVRKIHISGSMWPIHVLASTKMDPLQNPDLLLSHYIMIQIYINIDLRIIHKIHMSDFIHKYFRERCNIHISLSIFQCIYTSGSFAKSIFPDDLGIHVSSISIRKDGSGSFAWCPLISQFPYISGCLQYPYFRIRVSKSYLDIH